MVCSIGFSFAQETKEPVAKEAAPNKVGLVFQGKAFYLSEDITGSGTMVVNKYYPEGGKGVAHLRQRFILTKDDAKTVATNMAKSFEKMGKVSIEDNVAPNITGLVITKAGESSSFVTVSIFEKAPNGKGVFVKTYDIAAPGMPAEKLEGIVTNVKKKAFTDLVNAKFPRIQLAKKAKEKE